MIPYRIARELVYQLDRSHQQERLATMLSTIQMFVVLYTGETREEVLSLWKKLTDAGHDLVEAYRQSMEMYRSEGQSDEAVADSLKKLGRLLEVQGYWSMTVEMLRELLDVALRLDDRASEGRAHRSLGWLAIQQGRYDEAVEELEHALSIAQLAGGQLGEASAIGNIGIVYLNRGKYDRAMEYFERQRAISEELGDRLGLSTAIGCMGLVYYYRGEYDGAMESYERDRAICEELGDRRGLSQAIGNIGIVYRNRGEYERALECYERCRAIFEELGDRPGLSIAIGNMGSVYYDRGEYDQSLEFYRMALEGHRAIGFLSGVTYWLEGIARVLLDVVLLKVEPSEYVMSYICHGGVQSANWREAALALAREHADECLSLSEQLSKPDTLFSSRVLLARIEAAEGKSAAAVEQLTTMLAEATDDEQRAELQYWLWKLSRDEDRGMRVESESNADSSLPSHPSALREHRIEALHLYKQLLAKTPKHEYKQRIEELTTGGITA